MSIETILKFNKGPLPIKDDGSLAIIMLSEENIKEKGFEYYGQPVVVSRWSDKLKTTLDCQRLSYDDVISWIEI